MNYKENSEFNNYSNYINEIIEKKPNGLIRNGIGGMLFFLVLLLVAAWFIKYPDKLNAKVDIVTPRPPVDIVSQVNAPVAKIFDYSENDVISNGQPIIILESTTNYNQFLRLKNFFNSSDLQTINITDLAWLDSLGGLQPAYNSFALARLNLQYYNMGKPFDQKIASLKRIESGNALNLQLSKNYLKSSQEDYKSKESEFKRYQKLFQKGVISASEFEQIKQTFVQKEMSYSNDEKTVISEQLSIANLNREILDLQLQKTDYEQQLRLNLHNAASDLKSQMDKWEQQFLIKPPINGRLSYFNDLNQGDFVVIGERLLTIIPLQEERLEAIGTFPSENAGKVKKGDKVILKLDAYPYHEYGTVNGLVKRISEVPVENAYSIVISLPEKLRTNYDNKIIFKQRLTADADIITKDQSLIQRIFYQFEGIFKK
ncbi:MAG: HlyD family efflux transporter periplasmic adaptor subunit [Bacteroidota bacterium]